MLFQFLFIIVKNFLVSIPTLLFTPLFSSIYIVAVILNKKLPIVGS